MEATIEDFIPPAQGQGALVEIESARAIQEVQAAMIVAKKFRRNQNEAHTRIMKACERYSLADKATYAYPRGDITVKGPSIRLAEVIAQNWHNLHFGIRELSRSIGRSEAEAFAWDMETNTRQTKIFQVPHIRYSKKKGNVNLSDPRDIYENVANLGARRMRACILGLIPGDIVEDALAQCEKTVREGNKKKPLQDRIRIMLKSFSDIGVNQEMIEKRLDHATDTIIEDELIDLNNIGRSIMDNVSGREEWFELASPVSEKLKGEPGKPKKENIHGTKDVEPPLKEQTEKEAEEIFDEQDPIRAKYKDLGKRDFKKFVKNELNYISTLPKKYQDEIRTRYQKDFPDQPYPPDKDKTEISDEEKEAKILKLVEGSIVDDMGTVLVPCQQREGALIKHTMCDAPCMYQLREHCPTWTDFDKAQ